MNLGVNSTSVATSSASWKSGDAVSDQFPAGLRVLVVDDDHTCLGILGRMLTNCSYEVTKCSLAEVALQLLRDNRDGFDVVISDVHMPDMDGFKLLEHIGLEMDLPVIMMSADDSKSVVMKGVTHGACDYLIKPVRIEALKNIWQHVIRKNKCECKENDKEQSGSLEEGDQQQKPTDNADHSSSANKGNWRSSRKREEDDDDGDDKDDSSASKKLRVVWSVELHQQFVIAVNQLGIDKAVPKKILELMNVPGITRENVASHLQKYRLSLRRIGGQPQNGLGSSFLGSQEAGFCTISSVNSLDHHALASSAHSFGRVAKKSGTSVPIVDQCSIFSFDNPNIRFLPGQHDHNYGKQVNPLHQVSKQLVSLHQSAQPFGKMHMNVSGQSNSVIRQLVQPQAVPGLVFSPYGMDNVRAPTYTSLSQNVVSSQHQGRLDVLVQPGFAGDHWNGHMWNGTNLRQQPTPSHAGSSLRIKVERLPDMGFQNSLFYDQQQEGSMPVEDGFGYDEDRPDNLPV